MFSTGTKGSLRDDRIEHSGRRDPGDQVPIDWAPETAKLTIYLYTRKTSGLALKRYRRHRTMVNVSKEGQVYECEICGNVVVVKTVGGGELVCCGEPMKLVSG